MSSVTDPLWHNQPLELPEENTRPPQDRVLRPQLFVVSHFRAYKGECDMRLLCVSSSLKHMATCLQLPEYCHELHPVLHQSKVAADGSAGVLQDGLGTWLSCEFVSQLYWRKDLVVAKPLASQQRAQPVPHACGEEAWLDAVLFSSNEYHLYRDAVPELWESVGQAEF